MSNYERLNTNIRLGICGGGQLARMLAIAAHNMGMRPVIFASNAQESATRVAAEVVLGTWHDETAIARFLSAVDSVIFENEFVLTQKLRELTVSGGPRFFPSLDALERLRDKSRQKEILKNLSLPTAAFEIFKHEMPVNLWIERVAARWGGECVVKWGQFGYDGKGVFVYSSASSPDKLQDFIDYAAKRNITLFAEQKISFARELAMVGCLSTTGEFKAYPLVESRQQNGVCEWVVGPSEALGISSEREHEAKDMLERLGRDQKLVGSFAIEFFETNDGKLIVNEIAPRVHNTGHYTQDAAATSQFENHLRAVFGLPLGSTATAPGFAMRNLLGPAGLSAAAEKIRLPQVESRSYLHWYDKEELRPGRKLGHLNGRVESLKDMPELLKCLNTSAVQWEEDLKTGKIS